METFWYQLTQVHLEIGRSDGDRQFCNMSDLGGGMQSTERRSGFDSDS